MNGTKIADKISTKSILDKHDLLSVNQQNAQTKLLDNVKNYPIKVKKLVANDNRAMTCAITSGKLVEVSQTCVTINTFHNDAIKAWNLAPDTIKNSNTIWSAKKQIKIFVKTLPV